MQDSSEILATDESDGSGVGERHGWNGLRRKRSPAARLKKCQQNRKRHNLMGSIRGIVKIDGQIRVPG
jgi:hypothetical protein